jgi:hypothetical protein
MHACNMHLLPPLLNARRISWIQCHIGISYNYVDVSYNLGKGMCMALELAADMQGQLAGFGITNYDEVTLRQELERLTTTYTLIKLAEWPARRWKCHYRLMLKDGMYDAQNVSEAYARGILTLRQSPIEKDPLQSSL